MIFLKKLFKNNRNKKDNNNNNNLYFVQNNIDFQIAKKLQLILPDSVINSYNFTIISSNGLTIVNT